MNLASTNVVLEINHLGERLGKCPLLGRVDFAECVYLDAAAEYLVRCSQLRRVSFAGNTNLTDAAVGHIAQCPHLQAVDLSACKKLTDASPEHLSQCGEMQ